MEHLRALLRATLRRALHCADPLSLSHWTTVYCTQLPSLSQDHRSKLGKAAALLWAKLRRRMSPSVFKNHMTHLQTVTQTISEDVCWKKILDELIVRRDLTEATRQQQLTYVTAGLNDAALKLQAATDEDREHALD